jgi:TonB family protein
VRGGWAMAPQTSPSPGAALGGAGAAAAAAGFMGMTKLQLGLAGALVVAGTTGFIVQRQEVTDLRQNLAAAEQQVRSVTQAEAAQAASAQAPGGRSAELGRLQAEIRAVRAELNSAAARPPAVVAPPAVLESPIVGPVYDMQALDRAPKPTSQIAPRYPRSLRGAGVQGEAVIEFVVATDGTVRSPRVVKCSHPELADAALEAVRRWTFNPGEKDGKSVASRVQIPLVFRLNNEEQAEAVGAEVVPWF